MVAIWDKEKILEQGKFDYGAWIGEARPEEINKIQEYSEKTRLKIPYLIGVDAAHGYGVLPGKTVFPTAISMAATFNRNLVRDIYAASAQEIRSTGNQWTFAPCIDIVQDARWGRTGETYGEDPYLASELVKMQSMVYKVIKTLKKSSSLYEAFIRRWCIHRRLQSCFCRTLRTSHPFLFPASFPSRH